MNFASFDLNLLRVFDALMRERSATRAGQMIGMSQPAVSHALGRLRHVLSDEVFVRRGNDMVPTPRAEALAGQIREALAQIEQAITGDALFDPSTAERVFTLYGADFFSSLVLPQLSGRIAASGPGLRLRFLDSATGEVERLLRDSTIDAALERKIPVPDWISSQPIMHSGFVVVATRGHRALDAAGVSPGDRVPLDLFCELPHALRSIDGSMSGIVDEALRKVDRARRVVLALPHFHSVAVAVSVDESGLIACIPAQTADAVAAQLGLATYRPPVEVPTQELRLYWHRRHNRHPAHRWLRENILEVIETMPSGPA